MLDIVSILILCLSVLYRLQPYLISAVNAVSTDEAFHLYYIKLIKDNDHTVPLRNERAVGGPNYCTYPAFYHRLLSYLPTPFVSRYGGQFALLFDILSACALVAVISAFYRLSFSNGMFIIALYLGFPSLSFYSIGPRSFSLTPRNFSQFLSVLGFVGIIVYFHTHLIIILQLTAVVYSLNILSSKFALQYIVGTSIFLSIFFQSLIPVLFLINILLWAAFIGKERFFYQIKGQLQHSKWYINEGIKYIQDRFNWKALINHLASFQLRDAWQLMFFHNPLTRGILLNLPVFCLIFMLKDTDLGMIEDFVYYMVLSGFALWILTQFSIFRSFGEPERYIEYSLPPFILLLFSSPVGAEFIYATLIYSFVFCLYSLKSQKLQSSEGYRKSIVDVKNILRQHSGQNRILCTQNNETYIFAEPNSEMVVGFFSNNIMTDQYNYIYDIYPDINPDNFSEICDKYNVSHIVINKVRKKSSRYKYLIDNVLFEDDVYIVVGPKV